MNIVDIINGHIKNVLNLGDDLRKDRLKICYRCPLYSKKFGGMCNSRLWLNVNTGDVSAIKKEGYINGCGCIINAKARLLNSKCPAGKW